MCTPHHSILPHHVGPCRNVLENRVVSRFDDALARQELVTMADCADIMAETARGEAVLVQVGGGLCVSG